MAKKVHARLEGFPIDKDIVGCETPLGAIPTTLRPIFRDRNDFDAGASLGEQTLAALDDSAAMIVIASPCSASSHYVNEEVRLFKSRYADRTVIPLIIDGSPGGGENECFAPALRFVVDADGTVTDAPAQLLAADLREKGDGFDLALAKLVARLIGLAPDDVFRRAERERRKQLRLRAAVAAAALALAAGGGYFYWDSRRSHADMTAIAALVTKLSAASEAEAAVPDNKEALTRAITAIAEGASTDPRYAQALDLLKAGKTKDAEPLLLAVAEDKKKRADRDNKDAAAAYRNLGAIKAVSDPKSAREAYEEAAKLDPDDVQGLARNAYLQLEAEFWDKAQAGFERVIAIGKPGLDDQQIVRAHFGLGYLHKSYREFEPAKAEFKFGGDIARRHANADEVSAVWRGEIAQSLYGIGLVFWAEDKFPEALKNSSGEPRHHTATRRC